MVNKIKADSSEKERQLHDLLFDEENTISVEEALSNAKKRWQKK